ncbi:ABC transporter substrate-binding protein [Pararhodobacter oceanensis]|uniref:Nitrate ABC transporter substrate-binding protein n=1 Tax=Pararhodobacter oceanensis TaxID=2172121 RepID=A0A2T8HTG8_9RHOB|nr:ABC transporter substrate-binding protein [Pararhodobacter oceanensis]PVH28673.1 nitrate ABC transporter substrate-binding protein [Pararhodobacter oceanensis]
MNKIILGFTAAMGITMTGLMAQAQTSLTYLFPGPDFLPAFAPFQLALGKGYYSEEGLDVTFRIGNGGADVATQVAVGNADLGGGMGDTSMIVRANGLEVRGVAVLGGQGLTQLVWRNDSGITSIEEFAGHAIAVAGFQNTEFYNLRAALAVSGVNPDDVDIQSLGYGGIVQGMIAGSVSGMSGVPEWIVAIEDAGVELSVMPARDVFPAQAQAIIASDAYIAENPDAVRGFVSATLRAIHDIIDDPHQAAIDYVGFVDRHAENVDQVERIMRMYAELVYLQDGDRPIGAFDQAQLQTVQDFYAENEVINAVVPIEDVYTNDFVPD